MGVQQYGSWGCACSSGKVWGSYGEGEGTPEAAPSAPSASDYYTDLAAKTTTIFAPLVGQLTDPVRQMEMLRVQILNAKARGSSPQAIALLQAKYNAAQRAAGQKIEGERASYEWRIVGQLGVVSGIVVAGAFTLFLLSRIFRR